MIYLHRQLEVRIRHTLNRGKSILLLGARQTGKTTLIDQLPKQRYINLIQPDIRQKYEQAPHLLQQEIEALAHSANKIPIVVLDEIQKVPVLLDVAQDLIDRKIAQFIFTGSSARKLRQGAKVNLLPGRVVLFHLDPLNVTELNEQPITLDQLLLYGSLPGIITIPDIEDKQLDLLSYVNVYLEEEIRAEALVRNIGTFGQFLRLAAAESGNIVNFSKLSQEIGIAHTTIANYYQLLADCLVAEKIEPLTHSKIRRKLTKTDKYIFFDLGVRRICAREGLQLPLEYMGRLFEQFIGLELLRHARLINKNVEINFWRDPNGPEVDYVVKIENKYIPIEVKWTATPKNNDIKHLKLFCSEYENVERCYIICQTTHRLKLAENIYAINWKELANIFEVG